MVLPPLTPMADEHGTKVVMVVVRVCVPMWVDVVVVVPPGMVIVVVEVGKTVWEGPLPVPVPDPVPVIPGMLPPTPVDIGMVGKGLPVAGPVARPEPPVALEA